MCVARDGEDLHAHFAPDSTLAPITYNPHAHLGSGLDSAHDEDPHAAPATYVRHGMVSGIGAVLLRALRAGLPTHHREQHPTLGGNSASNEDREAQRLVRAVSGSRASRSVSGSTSLERSTSTSAEPLRHNLGTVLNRALGSITPPPSRILFRSRFFRSASSISAFRMLSAFALRFRSFTRASLSCSSSSPVAFAPLRDAAASSSSKLRVDLAHLVVVLPPLRERAGRPRLSWVQCRSSARRSRAGRRRPPAAGGMFSARAAGNIFTRFAGPRGGRSMGKEKGKEKQGREDLHHSALLEDAKDDSKANNVETTPRERPQIPRSASTPPLSISARASAIWENRERHGWARVPH
ncbi:hypothetical protein B0H14DRAFT_3860821 [Mycena olivaceomarginata]|nr:hypothetical protein B0H14DRAFT_3860821 [Mycena olivaceomarginata]